MADERAGAEGPQKDPANRNKIQTGGREENAAQPLNAAPDHGGPERYPLVDRTDGVQSESRSFRPDIPTSTTEGRMGPGADPCEGKDEP
jgi:hypothetical protein